MARFILDLGTLKLGDWSIPLRLPGYGFMLVLGFLVSLYLMRRLARRVGEDPEVITQCGILALICGIVGSRAAYIIQHWDTQFADAPNQLVAILSTPSGGLTYYGGVVLAIVAVLGFLRIKKLPIRRYLDILAVGMMVGLAFGRAGCLLNGCCYGGASRADWPLGMRFPMYPKPLVKFDGRENPFSEDTDGPSYVYASQLAANRIWPDARLFDTKSSFLTLARDFTPEQIAVAEASWSHPTQPAQAMGIINALLIAALLTGFHRLRRREGQVFAAMLVLYPITRFILESIRDDNPHDLLAGSFTHNQYTSIGMFIIGAAMLFLLRKLPAASGPTWSQRAAAESQVTVKPRNKSNRNRRY